MELPGVDCVNCDVLQELRDESSRWHGAFDTVVMNPPFGTKQNAGMDMKFLMAAINVSRGTVYSLHKTSTRDFIRKKMSEVGIKAEVIAELRYNLDSTYKFHKKASVDIEVDCWRIEVKDEKKSDK